MLKNVWMKLHCGSEVFDIADPRHVGRIDAIHHSAYADVTWLETGWRSLRVPLDDLVPNSLNPLYSESL